jgi:hypothetical protein
MRTRIRITVERRLLKAAGDPADIRHWTVPREDTRRVFNLTPIRAISHLLPPD